MTTKVEEYVHLQLLVSCPRDAERKAGVFARSGAVWTQKSINCFQAVSAHVSFVYEVYQGVLSRFRRTGLCRCRRMKGERTQTVSRRNKKRGPLFAQSNQSSAGVWRCLSCFAWGVFRAAVRQRPQGEKGRALRLSLFVVVLPLVGDTSVNVFS